MVCSRYVCLSGDSDISTDDLKKSPHSDRRSQIHGIGKPVQRAIQSRSAVRRLKGVRIGKERRIKTFECILGRAASAKRKEETFGIELGVIHRIFLSARL